ncbi:VCBS repeat-containing protein [Oscillospiraceae bacterium WX1]
MQIGRRYAVGLVCLLAMLFALSGCFKVTPDDLYTLPQASKEYVKLQEQINMVLAAGAEYAPPTSGPNRQAVQLKDLDGDGINEAVVFFRVKGDKPLRIYIMRLQGDNYETADVIDGDGTAIESIRYADMDGDGMTELVVGWQMSAALLHMSIYAIKGYQQTLLAGADYTALVLNDLDNDGRADVLALQLASSDVPGEAAMFSLLPDGNVKTSIVRLSNGLSAFSRIVAGSLSDGKQAVFAEGQLPGGGMLTDVLAFKNGALSNITLNKTSGISETSVRDYTVYSTDINKDGVFEVPSPRRLTSPEQSDYYVIDWLAFDSSGDKSHVFTTYHNFSDGWYLILPNAWRDKITVRREDSVSGERTIVFSYLSGASDTPVDYLKIYALYGDNRNDRAAVAGRFKLAEHGDVVYAAEIIASPAGFSVSQKTITDNFKLLYSDWVTGAL